MTALWPGMPGYEQAIQKVMAEVNPPRTVREARAVVRGRQNHETRKMQAVTRKRAKHGAKVKKGMELAKQDATQQRKRVAR